MNWTVNLRHEAQRFRLKVETRWQGKLTGIFGPSGCGKTTLVKHVLGLHKEASWHGLLAMDQLVLQDSKRRIFLPPRKRRFSWLPQNHLIFPHLNVRENLLFQTESATPSQTPLPFELISEMLQLEPLLAAMPEELSGGERQRVALGRALLTPSRGMVLDEPFSSLDRGLRKVCGRLIRNAALQPNLPILLVTHHWEDVEELCDHALILRDGHLAFSGRPQDVPMVLRP